MNEIEKLKQAAQVLDQVDVTDMITNLGIGIAKAQKALDDNSVKQAIALADPVTGLGGKSLLELGFAPAFYSFQYADVSAEMELRMRLATEFEIGGSLSFDFTRQGGYSKEKLDFLRKDRSSLKRSEYKSSRSFNTTSTNQEEITIVNNKVSMDQTDGSIDRIEKLAEDIREDSEVTRVETAVFQESQYEAGAVVVSGGALVQNIGGFVVVNIPNDDSTKDVSILKIGDYGTTTNVNYNASKTYNVGPGSLDDFADVYGAIKTDVENDASGTIIGYNSAANTYQKNDDLATSMEVYFNFDRDCAAIALTQTVTEGGDSVDNTPMQEILLVLAHAMKEDKSLKINIIGYTDGSGKDQYNIDLSNRRSESLKAWFLENGVKDDQVNTDGLGEVLAGGASDRDLDYRKVVIEFVSNADYFFVNANTTQNDLNTPTPDITVTPEASDNGFTFLFDESAAPSQPARTFDFEVNGESFSGSAAELSLFAGAIDTMLSGSNSFTSQVIGNSAYLLHNESAIKFTMYSEEQEELTIKKGSSESESFNDASGSYMIDETVNTSSRIKNDTESISNPNTIAAGVSISGRYSRQFSIDVSGNARVAARIVALPAPTGFLEEVREIYNS